MLGLKPFVLLQLTPPDKPNGEIHLQVDYGGGVKLKDIPGLLRMVADSLDEAKITS